MDDSSKEKDLAPNRNKIPFLFTPVPHFLFQSDYFRDPNGFRLIAWMFHRTAFTTKSYSMNGQIITLEVGEFLFGRKRCSIETGISEQSIRTVINQLINQQNVTKVTTKSTNKFSVYRWLYEHFPDSSNQQSNRKSTSKTSQTNHKQEYKNKEIEAAAAGLSTEKLPEDSSQLALKGKAKEMLRSLPADEQNAILTLFGQRRKNKSIDNPSGWIVQCIMQGWHKSKEVVVLLLPENEKIVHVEANRKMAQEIVQKLEKNESIQVYLRRDFLELGKSGSPLSQIFYYEPIEIFSQRIQATLKKLVDF